MARNGSSGRASGRGPWERPGGGADEVRDEEAKDELLTPGEVARLFGVNPKTITRWASIGKLSPIRTDRKSVV